MYEALAAVALSPEDPEKVVETVGRLRRRHPRISREDLARKLTTRTALTSAALGALGGSVSFQALALDRLLLSIARASGRPATPMERVAAVAVSILVAGASEGVRRQARRVARRLPEGKSPLLAAAAGAAAGGALGFGVAWLLGRAAERYVFEGRRLKS